MKKVTTMTRPLKMLFLGGVLATSQTALGQTDSTGRWLPAVTTHLNVLGMGHTDLLDTYLSQERFTGTELGYLSQSVRRRLDSRISSTFVHHIMLSSAGTRGNSNSLLTAMYHFMLGWHYNWNWPVPRISVALGGMVDGTLGGTYNTRNSNNPAQARAALSLDPAVRIAWPFSIGHCPLVLHYEAALPLIGAAFSPNYGQSYYEIFSRSNYDHNIVMTSPFSGPQLHQMLLLDFRLWRVTFTIGYGADLRQMRANQLKYHQYTHALLFGWRY